jgi:hypothetical protein
VALAVLSKLVDVTWLAPMQENENEDETKQKHPIEMTTDEAIDYLFHPEIAKKLRDEAGMNDPEECESED